jgi:hypothetical protein
MFAPQEHLVQLAHPAVNIAPLENRVELALHHALPVMLVNIVLAHQQTPQDTMEVLALFPKVMEANLIAHLVLTALLEI